MVRSIVHRYARSPFLVFPRSAFVVVLVAEALTFWVIVVVACGASVVGLVSKVLRCGVVGGSGVAGRFRTYLGLP